MSKKSKPAKPKPNSSVLPPKPIFEGGHQKKDSGEKVEERKK
ncbi:hypothetical protein Theba_0135 [Mesotoga prima MesG1.Ag.4.2]|uniref:Uncharacterized protein n=1 Tax=Mesotoga prima MesG1.Ag.4.2 TaxID=660470 RepID=I2F1S8_9BACT|nr:hypothetical protein [Mesotoga prima]AFK05881.1 hypothetical protein Theba_0135 [Mesotoga prima MesG1.Ag.4.2]